jgi:DNA modification methylase
VIQLHCGDYREVLGHVHADLIFTSPPYNIGSTTPRRDGFRKDGKFDPKSFGGIRDYPDNFPEEEYQELQIEFLVWAANHLNPGGVLVYNHKDRFRSLAAILPTDWIRDPYVQKYLTLVQRVIWDRGSTHNHAEQYLYPHNEELYILRRAVDGKRLWRLRNTKKTNLPQKSTVWRINRSKPTGHPAAFPLELAEAVLSAYSYPGDMVCDPYAGSGTVALAVQMFGDRHFEGSEIVQKYVDLARERLTGHTEAAAQCDAVDPSLWAEAAE